MTNREILGKIVTDLLAKEEIDSVEVRKEKHFGPGLAWTIRILSANFSVWAAWTIDEHELTYANFDIDVFIVQEFRDLLERFRHEAAAEAQEKRFRRNRYDG